MKASHHIVFLMTLMIAFGQIGTGPVLAIEPQNETLAEHVSLGELFMPTTKYDHKLITVSGYCVCKPTSSGTQASLFASSNGLPANNRVEMVFDLAEARSGKPSADVRQYDKQFIEVQGVFEKAPINKDSVGSIRVQELHAIKESPFMQFCQKLIMEHMKHVKYDPLNDGTAYRLPKYKRGVKVDAGN